MKLWMFELNYVRMLTEFLQAKAWKHRCATSVQVVKLTEEKFIKEIGLIYRKNGNKIYRQFFIQRIKKKEEKTSCTNKQTSLQCSHPSSIFLRVVIITLATAYALRVILS